MVAHHTIGGCNLRPGDLLGSGTISGDLPHQRGCLLELSRGGTEDVALEAEGAGAGAGPRGAHAKNAGEQPPQQQGGELQPHPASMIRRYLLDGDTVTFQAHCQANGLRIGFGECRGTLLPASA